MGRSYSQDLRERVIAAIESGLSTREAARRFSIGIATAGTWSRLKRAHGHVLPAIQGKPPGSVLDPHADFIMGLLEAEPEITMAEIAVRLHAERQVKVVLTAVWKFVRRRGLTHKKRPRTRRNKSGQTSPPRENGGLTINPILIRPD
jgi:transposase